MANLILDATVGKNASGSFEFWVRYNGTGKATLVVRTNGCNIVPAAHPTVAGDGNEVSWSAAITPAPQADARFTFRLGASMKDVIF